MHLTCCVPLLCRLAAGCLQHSSSAAWLHPRRSSRHALQMLLCQNLLERETAHQVCCRRLAEQQQSNSVPVKQDVPPATWHALWHCQHRLPWARQVLRTDQQEMQVMGSTNRLKPQNSAQRDL